MRAVPYFLSTLLVLSHIVCAAPVDHSLGIAQRTSAEAAEDTLLDSGVFIREAAVANTIAVREETEQTETSSDSTNNPGVFIRADAVKRVDARAASPTTNSPGRII
jgi:hypothetical protein